jgi:excisionase family DNA binding protein
MKKSAQVFISQQPAIVNPEPAIESPWLTVAEVSRLLQIHPVSVYKLCYKRRIPYLKFPGIGIRIPREELNQHLAQAKTPVKPRRGR